MRLSGVKAGRGRDVKVPPRRPARFRPTVRAMEPAQPRSIAVTGGIACGKSASGAALASLGVPVLDADAVTHELLANDSEVATELRARFGESVFRDGSVDRKALGRRIFADASARHDLERLLHPRIQDQIRRWIATADAPVVAVQVPLLFEVGWEREFDRVVCVACSSAVQRQRLKGRGLSEAEIDQRLAAQMPVEEKMKRAQVVIWTDGPEALQREQWARVMARDAGHGRQMVGG